MGAYGERAPRLRAPRRGGEDDGATSVEYALIAVLIAAVIAAVVGTVGQQVLAMFTTVSNGLP